MFPWNYGFHWSAGTIIFLGAFYTVLVVVATTLLSAAWRSRRALAKREAGEIRWHADFHELTAADRACRHVLTGEFKSRECPNAFDCRECETHARWVERHPVKPVEEHEEDVFGMAFPLDRFYHRGHTWARMETDGTVTVGLDELGKRLLGTPDRIELPEPGTEVRANATAFRVHRREADVRVLSPVDGKVIETGGPERGWYSASGAEEPGLDPPAARRGSKAVADAGNGAAATGAHHGRRGADAGRWRRAGGRHCSGLSARGLGRGLRRDVPRAVTTAGSRTS